MNRIRLSLFLDRHSSAAGFVLALVMAGAVTLMAGLT